MFYEDTLRVKTKDIQTISTPGGMANWLDSLSRRTTWTDGQRYLNTVLLGSYSIHLPCVVIILLSAYDCMFMESYSDFPRAAACLYQRLS